MRLQVFLERRKSQCLLYQYMHTYIHTYTHTKIGTVHIRLTQLCARMIHTFVNHFVFVTLCPRRDGGGDAG